MDILFQNGHLTLKFQVDDANHIQLTYFGDEENFLLAPSNILELELSETNHSNKNPLKKCFTAYGMNAKYLSHTLEENHLTIITHDDMVEVESHFRLYPNTPGLTTWQIVKNITNTPLHLEYISSFYLYGLGQEDEIASKDMHLIYARNGWNSECQWKKTSFIEAGLFNTNRKVNMNSFTLNNTGSWSTKEYLPIIGVENQRKHQFIMGQIENNGSWNINLGDYKNRYYLSLSGPTLIDHQFSKKLEPEERFYSCEASVVISRDFETAVQAMTALRRHIQKSSFDHLTMPVIFNDFMHGNWDLSSEALIKPMVEVASLVGCDVFVLDAGWFAKTSGWPDYIGEWKAYEDNFPSGGLAGMFDFIRSHGMKTGLWFEIEYIGEKCPILGEFSDDCFFEVNGSRSKHAQRYALNFSKRAVFNWALAVLSKAIEGYDLDYLKLDYNVDAGVGNARGADSLGEGLLKNNRALIRLIKTLQKKYPRLTIENCASGGQRMDYQMLRYCPIQSSSDLEDYRLYPYISANILGACPPEVGAIWSYPVCNDNLPIEITDEVVIFNMVNAMLGRLHLASKLFKLNETQLELVKEGVTLQKEFASFKKRALPIFPFGPAKFFAPEVVAGLEDEHTVLLNVWNTSNTGKTVKVNLSKYDIKTAEIIYPKHHPVPYTLDIQTGILSINFPEGYMARTFLLKKHHSQIINVLEHGVKDSEELLQTAKIQALIDLASKEHATLFFPKGTYVIGTVFLKSNVTIELEEGALILGAPSFDDYAPHEEIDYPIYQDQSHTYFHCAMFVGEDLEHIAIKGQGKIDMRSVWDEEDVRGIVHRGPKCIALKNCHHISITDLTIENVTDLAVYFAGCHHVEIARLKLKVYIDGISPDNSKHVTIKDCDVESGDDGIVFKSSYTLNRIDTCEDILVENCRIKSRCNAIKFGTETNGGFSNILMRNIEIFDSRITGISVESVDGAHIDHLHFENITMENVGTPFFVHLGKRMRGPSHLTIGSIRDVSFKNITAKGPYQLYHCLPWNYDSFLRKDTIQFPGFYSKDKVEAPGTWQITSNVCGLINHPLKNITFENITLELDGGVSSFETKVRDEPQPYPEVNTYGRYLPAAAIYFRDVAGLKLKNIQVKLIHDDARPLFVFDRVEDLIRV